MEVVTDERTVVRLPVDQLWAQLTSVDDYQRWWPWLEGFDGAGFATGERWACTVRPPLPYRVRFTIAFDEVVPGRSAVTTVDGDIAGSASLSVRPVAEGSELHLTARLAPVRPVLRALSTVARPVTRFGHDWVITTGLRQFAGHARPSR